MQELEIFFKTAAEALKALAKAIESIGERMEELSRQAERDEREERAAAEPVEKKIAIKAAKEKAPEKRLTAAQAVFDVIKRSRKGVNTARLKEKTGFDEKKIQNAIYKLKKQGKIKSERKGIYVKI